MLFSLCGPEYKFLMSRCVDDVEPDFDFFNFVGGCGVLATVLVSCVENRLSLVLWNFLRYTLC